MFLETWCKSHGGEGKYGSITLSHILLLSIPKYHPPPISRIFANMTMYKKNTLAAVVKKV